VTACRANAPGETRQALVLHDRPLIVDLITLTLNHGVLVVGAASTLAEADAILAQWRPDMAVIDMDHDNSTTLLAGSGPPTA
jgi:CheY-like chemotaxis protein